MADITISGLDAAVPPAGAVIPFSDGTTTNKVDINSIVGLTTNGTFRGTLQRGSYGSLSVAGSTNTWAGIDFTDASATLMVRTSDQYSGIFKTNNAWIWAFDGSGNLVTGAIPWANITGKPTNTGLGGMQAFTSGSGTWTVPTSVTKIKVTVVGGGGGGAGNTQNGGTGGSSLATYSGVTITGYGGTGTSAGGSASGGDLNIAGGVPTSRSNSGGGSIFNNNSYGTGGNSNAVVWSSGGGGGGAGGVAIKYFSVTPGTTLDYSVGGGGSRGSNGTYSGTSGIGGIVIIEW